jgi:hypothetical protein
MANVSLSKIFWSACLYLSTAAAYAQALSPSEAEAIGIEAYIYGYPLVTMDITRQVMTNAVKPENEKAPMGQFYNSDRYPNASFRDVTAPNADTLYSFAWIDLSKEPYLLHLPNENGRYYLMPMLSGWTDVFADPGTRTTGTEEQIYAITGPKWTGVLPDGVKEIKSPTNMVWILGRTYSSGTPDDFTAVYKLQDQYTLKPLSFIGKPYTPPKGVLNPDIDMRTPVRDQVNNLSYADFFNRLALLMKDNPPAPQDAPLLMRMSKIGIIPGQPFKEYMLDPNIASVLKDTPKLALDKIIDKQHHDGVKINGWHYSLNTGVYGTDYLQRAYIAFFGLGANKPQDAIYPAASVDSDGRPLDGRNKYIIHFDKGATPPVKAFWSLTMYDQNFFFVDNPLNRYNLSPRNPLVYNEDGSLDLYIQHAHPGKAKEANWLPAPSGPFNLMLRMYWPEASMLDGKWAPPSIKVDALGR